MNFNKNRNIAPNMKPSNFLRVDTILSPTETSDSSSSFLSKSSNNSSSSPLLSSSESEKKKTKKPVVITNPKPQIIVNNPQPTQPPQPTPPPAAQTTQNQPVQKQQASKNPSGPTNKSEVKIEKFPFNLEKFTQETISNMTIEKGVIISCVIFTVLCAIIGFWYLIFKMTNNQKYYNYSYKMPIKASYGDIPITSSVNRFMY